jgi:glycosyltransferase involved in cell wall biosynthesis
MERIAVVIEQSGISHNASIVNFLEFLSSRFKIDIFLRQVWPQTAAVLRRATVQAVEIRQRPLRLLWAWTKELAKKLLTLNWAGLWYWRPHGMEGMPSRQAAAQFPQDRYRCLVAFDPHGLLLCREIFPSARPFYYSLELYLPQDRANPFHDRTTRRRLRRVVLRQRKPLANIRGLIIQSGEREALFRAGFRLDPRIPALHLPVTSRGRSCGDKSDFLRKKYGLAAGTRIALHLGGIYGCYSCIELARAFAAIPGWMLVFQGLANRYYLERMRDVLAREAIRNTIISSDFYDQLEDLEPLLMSADLGIAWYNDISPNFTAIGRSSGKISSYLKFGLPVIVNRYPSTEEVIARNGCGVCVDDFSQIGPAIGRIDQEYERFAGSCRATYDGLFNFENYQQALLRFITG